MKIRHLAALLLASTAGLAPSAKAELMYGVTGTQLFRFDSAAPGASTTVGTISNLTASYQVVGMDFRPATGQMFVLGFSTSVASIQLFTIDLGTAALSTVGSALSITGTSTRFGFDFNPSVDRIRVTQGGGANFRLNPNDGTLAGTDTALTYDASTGLTGTPSIYGAAYSNNVPGGTPTTLYGYEFNNDRLVTVGGLNSSPSPNGGVVFNVGPTGFISASGGLDLDISGATGAAYGAVDSVFYSVNLSTGAFTSLGAFTGRTGVLDIAAVPEPSTYAMLSVAAVGGFLLLRRRRCQA